jgi:hypothetical protein
MHYAMSNEGFTKSYRDTYSQLEFELSCSVGVRRYPFTAGERLIIGPPASLPSYDICLLDGLDGAGCFEET